MTVQILVLILVGLVLIALGLYCFIRKWLTGKQLVVAGAVCLILLCGAGFFLLRSTNAGKPNSTSDPGTGSDPGYSDKIYNRSEESRRMDMVMWYDIDISPMSQRPQGGWFALSPDYPDTATRPGHYRAATPLLGLYSQLDRTTARQHLYWIQSLGCNALTADWTNYISYRTDGIDAGRYQYTRGVYMCTEVLLRAAAEETEFETPSVFVTARLNRTDTEELQAVLDDIYTLYTQYPEQWYFLDDGTERADKPFLVIFMDADVRDAYRDKTFTFDDPRFNIRYSNGGLYNVAEKQKDGSYVIPEDMPFWLFVDNEQDPSEEGMYTVWRKNGKNGRVEQMMVWTSVYLRDGTWDPMNHIVNGKTTFERHLRMVEELAPQVLSVNRFNYPMVWKEEPQEGLSLYESTHIEPTRDFGFLIFNNVMENLYALNKWECTVPTVEIVTASDQALFLKLNTFPQEYSVSTDPESDAWQYYNINNGIVLDADMQGKTVYIKVRNCFGESAVYAYTPDTPEQKPE